MRFSQTRRLPTPAAATSFCSRTPSGSWTSTGGPCGSRRSGRRVGWLGLVVPLLPRWGPPERCEPPPPGAPPDRRWGALPREEDDAPPVRRGPPPLPPLLPLPLPRRGPPLPLRG